MKRIHGWVTGVVLIMTLFTIAGVSAQDGNTPRQPGTPPPGPQTDAAEVLIYNVWAMPTDETPTIVLYMTIENRSSAPVQVGQVTVAANETRTFGPDDPQFAYLVSELTLLDDSTLSIALPYTDSVSQPPISLRTLGVLISDTAPTPPLIVVNAYGLPGAGIETPVQAFEVTAEPTEESEAFELSLYATLINRDVPTLNLIGASLPDYPDATVELLETFVGENRLDVRVVDYLPVPTAARLLLRPGGYFLRASNLPAEALVQTALRVDLTFEDGTILPVPFVVSDTLPFPLLNPAG